MILLAVAALIQVAPDDPSSAVHPRRFGSPGGVGVARGWYIWRSYDAKTGRAEVAREGDGAAFSTRVLPWATTYRHLVYGEPVDALRPGERVNLFFNPEGKDARAWLVHMQDEIGQMKGHGHAWRVQEVEPDGRTFVARGMHGDTPLEGEPATFTRADGSRLIGGSAPLLAVGRDLYLTWCLEGTRRVVHLASDAAGLETLRAEALERQGRRVRERGLGGLVEGVEGDRVRFLVFATDWQPARELKVGGAVDLAREDRRLRFRILSTRNLGAYGSGATELMLEGAESASLAGSGTSSAVVRLFPVP